MSIRYFKCPITNCKESTQFNTKEIIQPNKNFLICSKCNKKWIATLRQSCCGRETFLFVSHETSSKPPIRSVQSFKRK